MNTRQPAVLTTGGVRAAGCLAFTASAVWARGPEFGSQLPRLLLFGLTTSSVSLLSAETMVCWLLTKILSQLGDLNMQMTSLIVYR